MIKPRDKARLNVERDGEPKHRCQWATKRATGRAWREKRADGVEEREGEGDANDGGGYGRDKNHKSDEGALVPVRKGMREEGVSKNEQVDVVKMACPEGRMRGETPNKE